VLTGSYTDGHYHLSWKEIGGPILETGASSGGFGSRMIELSVQGQLNGKLERFWEPDGLRVEIDLPVQSLQRSARLHARSAN
jgi:two-component sensor histidine kinase